MAFLFKFTGRNDGFTLVEAIIAAGVSIVVMLGLAQVMTYQSKMLASSNSQMDMQNAVKFINLVSTNIASCTIALTGQTGVTGSSPSSLNIATGTAVATSVNIYTNTNTPNLVLAPNKTFGASVVQSVQLIDQGTMPQPPVYSGDTVHGFILNITLKRPFAFNGQPLSNSSTYLWAELNSSNKLTACGQANNPTGPSAHGSQIVSSSTTWKAPSSTFYKFVLFGGGGAGGYANSGAPASGGGAGASNYYYTRLNSGDTCNITVGSGATGDTSNSPAASGGQTTVSCTSGGANLGTAYAPGGSGGVIWNNLSSYAGCQAAGDSSFWGGACWLTTGGNCSGTTGGLGNCFNGQNGGMPFSGSFGGSPNFGGAGGSTSLGSGGVSAAAQPVSAHSNVNWTGNSATGIGAGGGGASSVGGVNGPEPGGNGTSGGVTIEW